MTTKYRNYIFLLTIIIFALLGGFFFDSYKEAFSLKETYNSTKRKLTTSFYPKLEGMFNYRRHYEFIKRKFL
jgi:hypothetical protein